jgi:hypothetical protein
LTKEHPQNEATPRKYEWACQWKTFLDGDYDRMITHHSLSQKPLSKSEAEDMVRDMLTARIPARLIERAVTDWYAAPATPEEKTDEN